MSMGDGDDGGGMAMHGGTVVDINCTPNYGDKDRTVQGQLGNIQDEELHVNVTNETILQMEFETLQDAEKFYKEYAHVKGFGMRLNDIYQNKDGEPQARRMVYSA